MFRVQRKYLQNFFHALKIIFNNSERKPEMCRLRKPPYGRWRGLEREGDALGNFVAPSGIWEGLKGNALHLGRCGKRLLRVAVGIFVLMVLLVSFFFNFDIQKQQFKSMILILSSFTGW